MSGWMNKRIKVVLQVGCFFLPWVLRRRILQFAFDFKIGVDARIGWSIILAERVVIEQGATIGSFNYFAAVETLSLFKNSRIGNFNIFGGLGKTENRHFAEEHDRVSGLRLGEGAAITNRHYLDCTNLIDIGKFSIIAGVRSQILTHSIDLIECKQKSSKVSIGQFCFVGTGVIILRGVNVSDNIVLAAGAVLDSDVSEGYSIYGGVPARELKKIPNNARYFLREEAFVD